MCALRRTLSIASSTLSRVCSNNINSNSIRSISNRCANINLSTRNVYLTKNITPITLNKRNLSSTSDNDAEFENEDLDYYGGNAAVRKPAPHFKSAAVINGEFKDISLEDFRGRYLILMFYPLDFTFVCPTEITAFSDRIDEFRKINCEVVACSTDSKFSHLAWTKLGRKEGGLGTMRIPLLSDITKQISRDYGVLLEEEGYTIRGSFIIDDKGIIKQITMNDTPVGRSVEETLRLVKAFQYVDKHGEVCPVDWTPGKDSMKADPEQSKYWFKKHQK